jgi:hypothetical protein
MASRTAATGIAGPTTNIICPIIAGRPIMFERPEPVLDGAVQRRPHAPIVNAKPPLEGVALWPLSSSHHRRPEIHNLVKVNENIVAKHTHRTITRLTILTGAHISEVPGLDRLTMELLKPQGCFLHDVVRVAHPHRDAALCFIVVAMLEVDALEQRILGQQLLDDG